MRHQEIQDKITFIGLPLGLVFITFEQQGLPTFLGLLLGSRHSRHFVSQYLDITIKILR